MPPLNPTHKGACHCGAIAYLVEIPRPLAGVRCNCSLCAMKGAVLVYVPRAALEVARGEAHLASYRFNTRAARHFFCPTCGIHLFHQTRADPQVYGINAATLEGVCPYADFPAIAVIDGIHHRLDTGGAAHSAGHLRYTAAPGG